MATRLSHDTPTRRSMQGRNDSDVSHHLSPLAVVATMADLCVLHSITRRAVAVIEVSNTTAKSRTIARAGEGEEQ